MKVILLSHDEKCTMPELCWRNVRQFIDGDYGRSFFQSLLETQQRVGYPLAV